MEAVSGLIVDQARLINPISLQGMGAVQVRTLKSEIFSGFSLAHYANFSPEALGSFNRVQAEQIPPWAMQVLSAEQISSLGLETISMLTSLHVQRMRFESHFGWTAFQISALCKEAFLGLSPSALRAVPPESLFSLHARQLSFILPETIRALSPIQAEAIPYSAWRGLDAHQLATLSPRALGSLTFRSLRNIPADAFRGMASAHIQRLSPQAFRALTYSQLLAIPEESWSASTMAEKLEELKPSYFEVIDSQRLVFLPVDAFYKVQPSQVRKISPSIFAELGPIQAQYLSPRCLSALSREQVAHLSSEILELFSESKQPISDQCALGRVLRGLRNRSPQVTTQD